MQADAHLAQEAGRHALLFVAEVHIALPLEVGVVGRLVSIQVEHVVGQIGGRLEIHGVYEAGPRHELGILATA